MILRVGERGDATGSQTCVENLCQSIVDKIVVVREGSGGGVALRVLPTCAGPGSRGLGEEAEEEGGRVEMVGSGGHRGSLGFGEDEGNDNPAGMEGHEAEGAAKVKGIFFVH